MVSVYNKNSVDVRNLLAATSPDDILEVQEFPCTARVEVFSAFFCQPYHGPRGISQPCMKIIGRISSLMIEDDDDRVFPCGSKEIGMMVPEDVMVEYRLSPEEIASLATKGLFHDPNYPPPSNLVGNVIEIPLTINYTGIYDTPVCAVEILGPNEITTSTKDNSYYGLFETCPVSEVIAQMENGTYEYAKMNEARPSLVPQFQPPEPTPEAEPMPEPENLLPEEQEDRAIIEKVADQISAEDARTAAVREEMETVGKDRNAEAVLHPVQEEVRTEQQVQAETEAPEAQLYREEAPADPTADRDKSKSPSHLYDRLMQHAQRATEAEQERQGETPDDQQFTKDGEAEAQEEAEGQSQEPVLSEDGEHSDDVSVREKANAKKRQEAVRRVDVGEDLKAMNEGRTDIAGMGAGDGESSEPAQPTQGASLAQELIARARAKAAEAVQPAAKPETPEISEEQSEFL